MNGVLGHPEWKTHPISDQYTLNKRMLRVLLLCELLCTSNLFHSRTRFLLSGSVFWGVHSKCRIYREMIPWIGTFLYTAAKALSFRSNQPLLSRLVHQDIPDGILPWVCWRFRLPYGARRWKQRGRKSEGGASFGSWFCGIIYKDLKLILKRVAASVVKISK